MIRVKILDFGIFFKLNVLILKSLGKKQKSFQKLCTNSGTSERKEKKILSDENSINAVIKIGCWMYIIGYNGTKWAYLQGGGNPVKKKNIYIYILLNIDRTI